MAMPVPMAVPMPAQTQHLHSMNRHRVTEYILQILLVHFFIMTYLSPYKLYHDLSPYRLGSIQHARRLQHLYKVATTLPSAVQTTKGWVLTRGSRGRG